MFQNQLPRKVISLFVICLFLSGVQLSQALAVEQENKCFASTSPVPEAIAKYLNLPESCNTWDCAQEAVLANIATSPADAFGWIVTYNLLMFIYFGRQCLETLDPAPCGAMVNHLMTALILGIILESF